MKCDGNMVRMYDFFDNFMFEATARLYVKKLWGYDKKKPWYFAVEGIEGSGKTKFIKLLERAVKGAGKIPITLQYEPMSFDIPEELKNPKNGDNWIISEKTFLTDYAYSDKLTEEDRNMGNMFLEDCIKDYNRGLWFINTPIRTARSRSKNPEYDEAKQDAALKKYRRIINDEWFDWDVLVKVSV